MKSNSQSDIKHSVQSSATGSASAAQAKESVIIIGGGICGMMMAAEVADMDITILEKRGELGGVFAHSVDPNTYTVGDFTVLSSSKNTTQISDYHFPEGSNDFIHGSKMGSYINEFADAKDLRKFVRFNSEVVNVEKDHKNNKWRVKYKTTGVDEKGEKAHAVNIIESDKLIIASGLHSQVVPLEERYTKFTGPIIPSHTIKTIDPKAYEGKRILILGGSETASDLVFEMLPIVAATGGSLDWSIRNHAAFFKARGKPVGDTSSAFWSHDVTAYDSISNGGYTTISPPCKGKPGTAWGCSYTTTGHTTSPDGHDIPQWSSSDASVPFGQFQNKKADTLPWVKGRFEHKLELMTDKIKTIEEGKIYVRIVNKKLAYSLMTPSGKVLRDIETDLPVTLPLKLDDKLKEDILGIARPKGQVPSIDPHGDVVRIEGNLVTFRDKQADGTYKEVIKEYDIIIPSFGFQPNVSYLPEQYRDLTKYYNFIFCCDDPSLALIGFTRPTITSMPVLADLTRRFIKAVWSQEITLPDKAAMINEQEEYVKWLHDLFRNTPQRMKSLVDITDFSERIFKHLWTPEKDREFRKKIGGIFPALKFKYFGGSGTWKIHLALDDNIKQEEFEKFWAWTNKSWTNTGWQRELLTALFIFTRLGREGINKLDPKYQNKIYKLLNSVWKYCYGDGDYRTMYVTDNPTLWKHTVEFYNAVVLGDHNKPVAIDWDKRDPKYSAYQPKCPKPKPAVIAASSRGMHSAMFAQSARAQQRVIAAAAKKQRKADKKRSMELSRSFFANPVAWLAECIDPLVRAAVNAAGNKNK